MDRVATGTFVPSNCNAQNTTLGTFYRFKTLIVSSHSTLNISIMKNLFFAQPQENPMIDLLPEMPQHQPLDLKTRLPENRSTLKKAALVHLLQQNTLLVCG